VIDPAQALGLPPCPCDLRSRPLVLRLPGEEAAGQLVRPPIRIRRLPLPHSLPFADRRPSG
jgi:hypothetical protein